MSLCEMVAVHSLPILLPHYTIVQDDDTALILATRGGHILTVKALMGGGADPNIQDRVSGSYCSTAGLCSNVCYCNHNMSIF